MIANTGFAFANISTEAARINPILESCIHANKVIQKENTYSSCEHKINNAIVHGEKIEMSFLDVMDDCFQFICENKDDDCINQRINAFLSLKKGDDSPCYGGG